MSISGFGDPYQEILFHVNREIESDPENAAANQDELTQLIDSTSIVFTTIDLPNTNRSLRISYLELYNEISSGSSLSSGECGPILLIDSMSTLYADVNSLTSGDEFEKESLDADDVISDSTPGSILEEQKEGSQFYIEFDLEELSKDPDDGKVRENQADSLLLADAHSSSSQLYTRKPKHSPKSVSMQKMGKKFWRKEEDEKLISLFNLHGPQWGKISRILSNELGVIRSNDQCAERWKLCLDPSISHHPWSTEENAQLERLVDQLGESQWNLIAHELSSQTGEKRTRLQCRNRWINLQNSRR